MDILISITIVCLVIEQSQVSATKANKDAGPGWNALKVKWNGFGKYLPKPMGKLLPGFRDLPRTIENLDKKKWELVDMEGCFGQNSFFVGKRYAKKVVRRSLNPFSKKPDGEKVKLEYDRSVIILTNKHGVIAGMQTSVPKKIKGVPKFRPAMPLRNTYYMDDGDYWTQTVYFVDPKKICENDRDEETFAKEGTGTGLWIQNGPNPLTDTMQIPLVQKEVEQAEQKQWGNGKCFKTMGQHYWYQVTKRMECTDFVPYCLLYNGGQLTGFCFAKNTILSGSNYDSPSATSSTFKKFIDPVPDCFYEDASFHKVTTLHVYFKKDAAKASNC